MMFIHDYSENSKLIELLYPPNVRVFILYYAFITGISLLATIRLSNTLNPAVASLIGKSAVSGVVIRGVQYGVAVLLPCLAAYQPSSIALYWLASNATNSIQQIVLAVPSVRRTLSK